MRPVGTTAAISSSSAQLADEDEASGRGSSWQPPRPPTGLRIRRRLCIPLANDMRNLFLGGVALMEDHGLTYGCMGSIAASPGKPGSSHRFGVFAAPQAAFGFGLGSHFTGCLRRHRFIAVSRGSTKKMLPFGCACKCTLQSWTQLEVEQRFRSTASPMPTIITNPNWTWCSMHVD